MRMWKNLIYLARSISEEEVIHGGSGPETRGAMSIQGVWENQTEVIIGVKFGDAEADSWKPVRMDKLLEGWEKINKDKHGQACYNQGGWFSLFVLSVDGMMGKEALVVLATFSRVMTAKINEPIFTSQDGLKTGLKLWLRGSIPGYPMEIKP